MPRIDVWDVPVEPPQTQQEPLWVGFTRGKLEDRFDVGKQLGQGGFGSVRVVVERGSGKEYACKSITKRLNVPNVSASKQNQHLENIRREALILRRLRGTLNVVHLEDMFEDEEAVHLVMEWCKGGELLQRINTRHYSERTAASYIRAVLRTLAQCHHLRILHRDIKPGNFMLLTDADKAPVKAIDFGLAVFFDPKKLPRKDLGLEGTPHFMAPEQLSGKTEPASDIWSAGVMAYQLLCGFVPFDDHKNPRAPALSLVWRAILTEEPKFSHRAWEGVSEEAKDFVRSLLAKDPAKRPTAKQALSHPWLQGKSDQRTQGAPLARTVVQRLQKFGVENALKRTVLDMIANDLINRHMEQLNRMQLDGAGAAGAAPPQPGAAAAAADPPPQPEPQAHAQAQGQQPAAERRFSRTSSTGRRSIEAAEATPEGAAAAAVAGSALPPPAAAADGGGGGAAAVTSRLRQLAAQDLLLRAAAPAGAIKHATVHAGGDALAALRRGQLLGLTLPLAVPPPAGGGGAGPPAGSLAAAIAALKQQQQPHVHRRRSHDLGKRPLGRAVTSINPDEPTQSEAQARPPLPAWHAQNQDHQQQQDPGEQEQQEQDGRTAEALAPTPAAAGAAAPGGALPPQLSLPSRLPATAPPTRPVPRRPVPLPGAASSPAGGSGAAAAAAAAGASAASTSSGYRGPVKDLAAATAWDMSFMKNRLALEGSGHALQHYAWLLNVGERSLHGVLERSFHAGAGGRAHHPHSGEPTATGQGPQSPAAGLQQVHSLTAVTVGSPAAGAGAGAGSALPRRSHLGMGAGQIGAQPASPAGASPGAVGGGSGSGAAGETVAGSSPDYLRMLSLVARQRAEHRKYQRLSLDTSGHRQTHYEELMAAEAEAGAAAGGDPRVGSFQEMAPPQEADEEEEAAAGASGTATASADTTGAFSLPPPSGATSAFDTTATSLTPPTEAQLDAAAAASPSAQRLPQTPLQQALQRQSRSGATASVPPSPAPSGTRQLSRLSAQMSLKPSIPGLAEADALGVGNAGVGGEPAAPLSGLRGGSEGGMSYESSSPADGGGGGEESLAGLEEDGGAAGAARLSAAGSAGGEGGKRSSLLRKVRKALMNPVKNLLGSSKHSGSSAGKATGGGAGGAGGARQSGAGTGATTPLPGAATPGQGPLAKLSAALAPSLAAVSVGSVSAAGAATDAADERGRGRGAYAAFLQFGGGGGGGGGGTGTATPQDVSAHGGTERSVHGGRERSVHGGTNDRSAHSDRSGHFGREGRTGSATQLLGPAGYAIHTVKAHKTPPAAAPQAAAAAAAAPSEAAQAPAAAGDGSGGQEQDQQQQQQPAERGAGSGAEGGSADAAAAAARVEGEGAGGGGGGGGGGDKGGITQGDLAPALDLLLGDPAKTAELQEVMRRLQYDKAEELTYEQLSEGLQWLGYRLEPSEVQDLLRQVAVGANEGLTASQFIASQVDWRTFQANHRAEWLDCLRKAFEELGGGPGPGGRVSMDQLMAALNEKLPEEEVNLAVQESLMDAAVEADEVDFDAFVRLMRCNSNDSLASGASSEMSYDLYDPRLKDSSLHGPLGDGVHYHPALETVPDDPE